MAPFMDRFGRRNVVSAETSAVDHVSDYSGTITATAVPSSSGHVQPSNVGQRIWSRLVRSASYALASFPLTILWITIFSTLFTLAFGLAIVGIGLLLLPFALRSVGIAGHVERWVLLEVLNEKVEAPTRLAKEPGLRGLFLTPLQDASYWRELAFLTLRVVLAPLSLTVLVGSIAFPAFALSSVIWGWFDHLNFFDILAWVVTGLTVLVVGPAVLLLLTSMQSSLAQLLLGPGRSTLTQRANTAVLNRDRSVAAAEAERRRIERDLHDGAQARLSTVALDLGRAKRRLEKEGGDEELGAIIDSAHNDAKQAIVELRNLARGIHPAVLTDRGLDAALSTIAARCTVPVHLDVHMLERPSPHIESAAYFAVSELLTNITKHSRASHAWVIVRGDSANLRIDVSDDGVGGAEHALGSGLLGLHERITGLDGTFTVRSPLGTGTGVAIEIPLRQTSTGTA